MDKQVFMLYAMLMINQVIAYSALIYLAVKNLKDNNFSSIQKPQKIKDKQAKKQNPPSEENADISGKYLDYINNFEVEV